MDLIIEYQGQLMSGTWVTIKLAILSLIIAVCFGLLGAWAKLSKNILARQTAAGYTTIVRGVPDLVLILLIYFGGQRLLNGVGGFVGASHMDISKFWAGVISIGFIYGAYLTETFRGAYMAVPRGQAEAAKSMGMKTLPILWMVLLPQIMRVALPGYGNVFDHGKQRLGAFTQPGDFRGPVIHLGIDIDRPLAVPGREDLGRPVALQVCRLTARARAGNEQVSAVLEIERGETGIRLTGKLFDTLIGG